MPFPGTIRSPGAPAKGQLELFASLGVRAALAKQVMEAVQVRGNAKSAQGPTEQSRPLHVVVFAGHRFDKPHRFVPRFPVALEKSAYGAIESALRNMSAADDLTGLGSVAPGADILFHEACKELGIPSTICLPMQVDEYV